jgi:hypothetical protein
LFVDKATELQKHVVVLTHQFVTYNKGALDDRDLFVIDEAIYATATVTLKLEDFAHALTWATSTGTLVDEFIQAHLDEEESRHAAALETHQRNQLASNDTLVELGKRVAAAPPEEQAAVFAAVEKALA